jgi:hypothetical protein
MTVLDLSYDTLTANVAQDEVIRLEYSFKGSLAPCKMIPISVSAGTPQVSSLQDGTFVNIAIADDEIVTFGALRSFFRVTGASATVQFTRI